MAETQEEADRQFALMLSREAYYEEDNNYYGLYEDADGMDYSKKKKRKSSTGKDDEWNPLGRKSNKRALKKTPVSATDGSIDQKATIQEKEDLSVVVEPLKEHSTTTNAPDAPNVDPVQGPKKYKTVPEGMNTGKFSEDEVAQLREGLDLYGRDWSQIAAHVKTRDEQAIRSHVQKLFIKLYRDGLPLPAKVLESGTGYTLSGKELDPDSAAARPYLKGKRKSMALGKENEVLAISLEADGVNSIISNSVADALPQPVEKSLLKKPKGKKKRNAAMTESSPEPDPVNAERTNYAKSRPVRESAKLKGELITFSGNYDDENAHRMIPCEKYMGVPGSGVLGSQPFKIKVNRRAILMMDLHAHLLSTEVIGFLAGTWNPIDKILEVDSAIPCRSMEHADHATAMDRHTNVELDPASEVEMRELVEKQKLRVVGWYHSHPTFVPNPSMIDLVNQKNYQEFFRSTEESSVESSSAVSFVEVGPKAGAVTEPFIGVIVGPYDPNLPKSASAFNWFNVGNREEDMNRPKSLAFECGQDNDGLEASDVSNMIDLVKSCGARADRIDFTSGWRQERWETRIEKLKTSLAHHALAQPLEVSPISKALNDIQTEISNWPSLPLK